MRSNLDEDEEVVSSRILGRTILEKRDDEDGEEVRGAGAGSVGVVAVAASAAAVDSAAVATRPLSSRVYFRQGVFDCDRSHYYRLVD